jgi:serine/threonine-protein kinase
LLDFGIARSDAMPREARTGTGVVVGSLAYMAPERFAAGTVTHESDVFGLGCCLFEVLAVERYYPPHRSREVPALSVDRERFESWRVGRLARLEAIDRPIVELLGRMLAWDPSERPRSSDVVLVCEELADAVRGPTLAAWARARAWPTVEHARGPWTGRVVVDEPMGAGAKSHAR